jgi:hypothetical protein
LHGGGSWELGRLREGSGHQMNGSKAQEWNIVGTDETGYRYATSSRQKRILNFVSFNVAAGTALDLTAGRSAHGTPAITYHNHGGPCQLWFLERRSFNTEDVSNVLTNCQYSSDQFERCGEDRECV